MEFADLFASKKAALASLESNAQLLKDLAREEAQVRGLNPDNIRKITATIFYRNSAAKQEDTNNIFVANSSKGGKSADFEFDRQIDGYDYKIIVIF